MQDGITKDWTTEAGLRAVIRFVRGSHYCGYVAVEPGHPWYGIEDFFATHQPVLTPHGGVTYLDGNEDYPAPSDPATVWWVGFDCAHWGDLSYSEDAKGYAPEPYHSFKDAHYVESECERLAHQLKKAEVSDG